MVQERFAMDQRSLGLSRNHERTVLALIIDRFDPDNLSFCAIEQSHTCTRGKSEVTCEVMEAADCDAPLRPKRCKYV